MAYSRQGTLHCNKIGLERSAVETAEEALLALDGVMVTSMVPREERENRREIERYINGGKRKRSDSDSGLGGCH